MSPSCVGSISQGLQKQLIESWLKSGLQRIHVGLQTHLLVVSLVPEYIIAKDIIDS